MTAARYTFTAELWEWGGTASWFFVSLPEDVADDIEERFRPQAGAFGSIRVEVTIGSSTWRTSLFPDTRSQTYVLPVKKAIRTAGALDAGSVTAVDITVLG